jgi:hypothetical protein
VHAAGLFGVGMDVDGDDIVDLGQRKLGHLDVSRRSIMALRKDYTI